MLTIKTMTLALTAVCLLACTKNKVDLPPGEAAAKPEAAVATAQAAPASAPEAVSATAAPVAAAASLASSAPAAAGKADDTSNTRLSGEVASQTKSQLSFRVGGFIQDLKVKTGYACKKGEVLAVLDVRDNKLAVDMARSQKELAKIALVNSESEYQRETELKKEKVSTDSMFDTRKAAYDKSRIDLQMAELKLTQAEQALQDTKLTAPYDCVVTKQLRNIGESVKPGDAVFELYNTSDVEMNFSVPERLAGRIKVGDRLKVSIPATGFSGQLEVIRLIPVVEQASRSFRVIAKAPDGDQRIVPGLYAEAQLL